MTPIPNPFPTGKGLFFAETVVAVIPRDELGLRLAVKGKISVKIVVVGLAIKFVVTDWDFANLPFDFHHASFKETAQNFGIFVCYFCYCGVGSFDIRKKPAFC